ncbi:MAG: amino acid ABC transporter substrate-binding protein [Actinomycetota bacterium]|nr:amino acid ABC transporter substrate-binding protein [Actinomycetota bacterium]
MQRSIWGRLFVLLVALMLVGAACDRGDGGGGTEGEGDGDNNAAAQEETSLLDEVIERGSVRCGVNETVPGFGFAPEGEEPEGFDIDFCRAFAAAITGSADNIELVPIDADNRFIALQNGDYDILVRNTTWTTSRDAKEGVAFAHPNFYDGQAMMVRTGEFGSIDDMDGTQICVTSGTTTELNLADYFGERDLEFDPVSFEDNTQLQRAFIKGQCDGWTSDRSQLAGIRSAWPANDGGPEALEILEDVMSKEPLAPGVLDTQIDLRDVIDAVVNGVILAEELGVSSKNVQDLAGQGDLPGPVAALLGAPVIDAETGEASPPDFGYGIDNDFMVTVLSEVGNYGEIFDRHVGPSTPLGLERGLNALWTDGGIQYAIPFR